MALGQDMAQPRPTPTAPKPATCNVPVTALPLEAHTFRLDVAWAE